RAGGRGAVRVPRALQLRVLLRGLHAAHGDHRRERPARRPHAGDRPCRRGRGLRAPEAGVMHVAIVMDGNGRWATRRGRPRVAGHERGAARIGLIVEAAPALGIRVLTLYAFSADNWRRPAAEVETLMTLFERYLCGE